MTVVHVIEAVDGLIIILVMGMAEEESDGAAMLMFTVGYHLVEDLTWFFGFKSSGDPIVERDEFQQAVDGLIASGYRFKTGEAVWTDFSHSGPNTPRPSTRSRTSLRFPPRSGSATAHTYLTGSGVPCVDAGNLRPARDVM